MPGPVTAVGGSRTGGLSLAAFGLDVGGQVTRGATDRAGGLPSLSRSGLDYGAGRVARGDPA